MWWEPEAWRILVSRVLYLASPPWTPSFSLRPRLVVTGHHRHPLHSPRALSNAVKIAFFFLHLVLRFHFHKPGWSKHIFPRYGRRLPSFMLSLPGRNDGAWGKPLLPCLHRPSLFLVLFCPPPFIPSLHACVQTSMRSIALFSTFPFTFSFLSSFRDSDIHDFLLPYFNLDNFRFSFSASSLFFFFSCSFSFLLWYQINFPTAILVFTIYLFFC